MRLADRFGRSSRLDDPAMTGGYFAPGTRTQVRGRVRVRDQGVVLLFVSRSLSERSGAVPQPNVDRKNRRRVDRICG